MKFLNYLLFFCALSSHTNAINIVKYTSANLLMSKDLLNGTIKFNNHVNPQFITNYYENALNNIKNNKSFMMVVEDENSQPLAHVLLTLQQNGYMRNSLVGLDAEIGENKIEQMAYYLLEIKKQFPNNHFCAFFPHKHLQYFKELLSETHFKEDNNAKCSEQELIECYGNRDFESYVWYSDREFNEQAIKKE